MKANIPEKLYISDSELNDAEHCIIWFKSQQNNTDIEYTRTDAFIEKACGWIKENITNNPNANSVLVRNGCVTLGMLVDDFKKYMEL